MQLTHSLKTPGFNPCTCQVRNRLQAFAFKCNLYRYIEGVSHGMINIDVKFVPVGHALDVRDLAARSASTQSLRASTAQVGGCTS
jgi:hypothetical protein